MVIPRDVDEAILRAERDELIPSKKCAVHVSPFESAMSAYGLLLHAGVANTTDEECRDYEHASHTPNENKMSDGGRGRASLAVKM
jgi:hypothetical protein